MQIERATLDTCHTADGVVVAIDVIRAFTTAAFAFAAGAQDIFPVGTIEEAFALRDRFPGTLMMGEVRGHRPDRFDFGNTPSVLAQSNLQGRQMIQRTGAGTQGLVRSANADILLAASFVCANATVRYIQHLSPTKVTLVATGFAPEGAEDDACADYLAARLRGEQPDAEPFLERVRNSYAGQRLSDPNDLSFPAADLDCCVDLDRFDFAMPVERKDRLLIMRPISISSQG
ncbi:MAG: 2-phosphosulfolactate phosphatase [Chloroflexota bacterium]